MYYKIRRVLDSDDDKKGPKRCQTCVVWAISESFYFLRVFYILMMFYCI